MTREPFYSLMQRFLDRQIDVRTFCAEFTKLWMQERDVTLAKKTDWPQPHDEQLITSFRLGEISESEFQRAYSALWGNAEDLKFGEAMSALHSACDCWRPSPEKEWEINEKHLRQEVEAAYHSLTQSNKLLAEAA